MRLLRVLLGAVLLGLIGFVPAGHGGAADSAFGVGMVPFLNGGDKAERYMHQAVGDMPEIDRVYNINDSLSMLRTLERIKQSGRQINYLVIGGHGSRDTPGIKFAKDDMIPEEIDLKWNESQLRLALHLRANPQSAVNVRVTPQQLDQQIKELKTRIAFLKTASEVMAKDAVVLLVNCSAAATPRGQKFVHDFGEVLLGKRGGHIIASKSDIYFHETYTGWLKGLAGVLKIKGEWVSVPITGSNPNAPPTTGPKPPATPTPTATANTWAGVWNTDYGKMTLDAGGSGKYEGFNPGTITGKVTGNVNTGTWNQPGDPPKTGTFKFTMSPDGHSFTGSYAYSTGGCSVVAGCAWNGSSCIAGACTKNSAH
jgi:hypothetical protein